VKPYRFINDLTSDVMFEATGKTLNGVFENAAAALFEIIAQAGKVKPVKKVKTTVKGESLGDLMFNWLQELITLVDTEEMFFSKFVVKVDEKAKTLNAVCCGEPASPEKAGTVVKAVTYYKYKFEKTKAGYRINAALDI
jgi:SHS2 domain-containing protein